MDLAYINEFSDEDCFHVLWSIIFLTCLKIHPYLFKSVLLWSFFFMEPKNELKRATFNALITKYVFGWHIDFKYLFGPSNVCFFATTNQTHLKRVALFNGYFHP